MGYRFNWDSRKAAANLRKHGIAFDWALLVFRDPLATSVLDGEHSDRWITVGEVDGRLIVVVHGDVESSINEGEINTRIISARRATRPEQDNYRER